MQNKAGRKCKYKTHIEPYLKKIPEWYLTMTETQIAKKLKVSLRSWNNYKKQYPELTECLLQSKDDLINELKGALKKKAQGFYYEETTKTVTEENGKKFKKVETKQKYAQPDTGAIHLLLKNLDPEWHNDDIETISIKKKQTELMEKKVELSEFS